MRKRTFIFGISLGGLLVTGLFLYSKFVGFEKPTLASSFPGDTLAFLEIRHVRKAAYAFSTDEQLLASIDVISAIIKTISDAASDETLSGTDVEIDTELLRDLGSHFKTRVALATLAPKRASNIPSFILGSYFYGNEQDLRATLDEIAQQASSKEEVFSIQHLDAQGFKISKLNIEPQLTPSIEPCWAVYKNVFYLATTPSALLQILEYNRSPSSQTSLQPQISLHHPENYVPDADLYLAINGQEAVKYSTEILKSRIKQKGGMWLTFSPSTFFGEMGISNIDSALIATDLRGKQTSYSSIIYNENLNTTAGENAELFLNQAPNNSFLYASQSLNIDAGEAIERSKNAFLKAAPLANFAYFGIRSNILGQTGLDFEDILKNAFLPQLIYLQCLDTGTQLTASGSVQESVILDRAFKIELRDDKELKILWSYLKDQLSQSTSVLTHEEGTSTFFDLSGDSSITGDRLAVDINDNFLTIGKGTLKCFQELKNRKEIKVVVNPPEISADRPIKQIGEGYLSLQSLPQQLLHLATVFYLQMNPKNEVPSEFYDFDWSALSVLEQDRVSKTFLDSSGHVFRISEQTNDD